MDHTYAVIMAGGGGTRLWPISRRKHPKHFLPLLGERTLFQTTLDRLVGLMPLERTLVVTTADQLSDLKLQAPELPAENILIEPQPRGTASVIGWAAVRLIKRDPQAVMLILPSDHFIRNLDLFQQLMRTAVKVARASYLVTLGIAPTFPATGYGYIQFEEGLVYPKDPQLKKVKTFTEKPDLDLATTFIKCGDFLWNAGIFVWSLKSIMKAFSDFLPEINILFRKGIGQYGTSSESAFINEAYGICKSISIDYGIMEKASDVYVLAVDFGWSDLGTWGSLYENRSKDENGNAVVGKNVMLFDSSNCIVNMPHEKLVVLEGLNDYIVVESEYVLLVCKKSDEQQIRQFVNDVRLEKGEKYV